MALGLLLLARERSLSLQTHPGIQGDQQPSFMDAALKVVPVMALRRQGSLQSGDGPRQTRRAGVKTALAMWEKWGVVRRHP